MSAASFECKLGQVIRGDSADNLQTFRAHFVDRVTGSVPPGEIKIDDVESWDPDRIQRRVVVNDFAVEVAKIPSQLERIGRGKNIVRHLGGRVRRQRNIQRTVAHHVEQDSAAKLFRPFALKLLCKIAATVKAIASREIFISFFAVKKHKLDLRRQIWVLSQHSRQFQEQAGARTTVIRPDKTDGVEGFCVIMGAQQKRYRRISLPVKSRD